MSKRKHYLWLPYLSDYKLEGTTVRFVYKGGKVKLKWTDIHSIMLYGKHVPLTQELLEKSAFYNIPVIIHRRSMPRAVWINANFSSNREDLLTKQILIRENKKKSLHISRQLLKAKFQSMSWLVAPPYQSLYKIVFIKTIRNIEANHSRRYWEEFYKILNVEAKRRDKDNIVSKILDATSKFVSGIILRWILYHKLSPYHAFLHETTDYPSLVYDFLEPYRGYFDKVVFDTLKENEYDRNYSEDGLIAKTIENIKKFLDTQIYVESTRQIVSFHELLHGVVLSFRAYLLKDAKRFIIPLPSKPNGGRPIKAGFLLYGHKAGKTDFWQKATNITYKFSERMKVISKLEHRD